jgi:cytochrome c oxidase assembly protein subunit 15
MSTRRQHSLVGNWLLIISAMIFGMVIGGGDVRTTGAGFMLQQWQPLFGILPPQSHAAWAHLFGLYQRTAQFQTLHPTMSLAQFKALAWPDILDRDWGRMMALAFAVPLAFFWRLGWISAKLGWWLLALFAAGAIEATMGWMMTYQGMFGLLHPSPLYLGPHFVLAMAIFTAMLWTALSLRHPEPVPIEGYAGLRSVLSLSVGLLIATIGLGALVAGSGGLKVDHSFPLMNGHFFPRRGWALHPAWLNLVANPRTVQFEHRVFATVTAGVVIVAAAIGLRAPLGPRARDLFLLLAGLITLQYILGMSTVVSGMADLGYIHELTAVLLLAACIACRHALRGATPRPVSTKLTIKAAE